MLQIITVLLCYLAPSSLASSGEWVAVASGNWSDPLVWNHGTSPGADSSVRIPDSLDVTLDIDSAPLASVAIDGGSLEFAPMDLHLQSAFIILTNGGRLQAGSESQPFEHELVITLLGSRDSSQEVPVFGAKAIAIAGGHLELHGTPRQSWTRLAAHASNMTTSITVESAVDWSVGQYVVIASTDFDSDQTEVRRIQHSSGKDIGLDSPLAYSHFGELQLFGGKLLDERAEVGLITRNIVIRGDASSEVEEFGCQIMTTAGSLQLDNVEVKNCGQRSSLARYPVHFHLCGNATGSYIRNSSIHHNYNRAVALHGVHSALVKDNVVYDTKGHAIFAEDAIETKNVVQGNLVMHTRVATSLLHTDQTPAAFWITNPDNDFSGNVAAGSERYGFWFSLPGKPTGPSESDPLAAEMCPVHSPLHRFADNKAHSCARNGLHIYVEWTALVDGYGKHCSLWKAEAIPVFLDRFTAYKCRGAGYHAHRTGEIRCVGCTLADCGYAWQHNQITLGIDVRVDSSLVVGQSRNVGNPTSESCHDVKTPCCTENGVTRTLPSVKYGTKHYGVQIPFTGSISVLDTVFANFNSNNCEYTFGASGWEPPYFDRWNNQIESHALVNQFQWYTSNIMELTNNTFVDCGANGSNAFYFWHSSTHDGANHAAFLSTTSITSLGVAANETIVAAPLGALVEECTEKPSWNAYLCPKEVEFRPLHVYNREEAAEYVGPMSMIGQNGVTNVVSGANTIQFFPTLAVNHKYELLFDKRTPLKLEIMLQQATPGNAVLFEIRYDSTISEMQVWVANSDHWGDWYDSTVPMASQSPSLDSEHASWYYDFESKVLVVAIKYSSLLQSKVKVEAVQKTSQVASCGPTLSDDLVLQWSHSSTWSQSTAEETSAPGMSPQAVPIAGEDVVIGCGYTVQLDISPPALGNVVVYGTLVFAEMDLNLTASSFRVLGGGVVSVGTATQPFLHQARIQISGDRYSTVDDFGARVFAVSAGGRLELHGSSMASSSWSKLSETASPGDEGLHLDSAVLSSWRNRTVVITSSSLSPGVANYETAQTTEIEQGSLKLSSGLEYSHRGSPWSQQHAGTPALDDRAAVGLLSRNIVIEAEGGYSSVGCKILINNGSLVHMQGVEIKYCGQTQVSAAIEIESHSNATSYVRNCSIHHSADTAVSISGGKGSIHIQDNVIFHSAGPAIEIVSGAHNVERNLVVESGVESNRVGTYLFNTRDTPAFLIRTMGSAITGNMASGGVGSGFLFALGRLADWAVKDGPTQAEAMEIKHIGYLGNNSAHNFALAGVTVCGWSGSTDASLNVDGLQSFNNGRYGLHVFKSSLNLIVSNSVFANAAKAGVKIESWFPAHHHSVTNTLFIGSADDSLEMLGEIASAAGILAPQFLGGSQLIGGNLLVRPRNTCPCSYNQLSPSISTFSVADSRFVNYSMPQQAAFQTNSKGDGAHVFWSRNLTFERASPVKFPVPQCQSQSQGATSVTTLLFPSGCDAATQAVIFDDGSIAGHAGGNSVGPGAIVANNSALVSMYEQANDRECVAKPDWNAYICSGAVTSEHTFMPAMLIESLDDDAYIRYMGPIAFSQEPTSGPPNIVYGRQDDSGMHLSIGSIFMATLLANQTYSVTFGGTIPKHLMFSFRGTYQRNPEGTAMSVDLLLPYKRPALLRVFKDGAEVGGAHQDCVTGMLRLRVQETSVYEIVTSGGERDSCYCCTKEVRALMSVTIRLNMHISSAGAVGTLAHRRFEELFARDISSAMGIEKDRILITGITAGSIIVNFQVLSVGSANASDPDALRRTLQEHVLDPASKLYDGDVTSNVDAASVDIQVDALGCDGVKDIYTAEGCNSCGQSSDQSLDRSVSFPAGNELVNPTCTDLKRLFQQESCCAQPPRPREVVWCNATNCTNVA